MALNETKSLCSARNSLKTAVSAEPPSVTAEPSTREARVGFYPRLQWHDRSYWSRCKNGGGTGSPAWWKHSKAEGIKQNSVNTLDWELREDAAVPAARPSNTGTVSTPLLALQPPSVPSPPVWLQRPRGWVCADTPDCQ